MGQASRERQAQRETAQRETGYTSGIVVIRPRHITHSQSQRGRRARIRTDIKASHRPRRYDTARAIPMTRRPRESVLWARGAVARAKARVQPPKACQAPGPKRCRRDGTGRRGGLARRWAQARVGPNPTAGTRRATWRATWRNLALTRHPCRAYAGVTCEAAAQPVPLRREGRGQSPGLLLSTGNTSSGADAKRKPRPRRRAGRERVASWYWWEHPRRR